MTLYHSDGQFSVWDCSPSLNQLLIRNSSIEVPGYSNEDIMFIGVFYMQIPFDFKGIQITSLPCEEYSSYSVAVPAHPDEKYFLVKSQDKEYLVGALAFSVYYTDLPYNISGLDQFAERKQLVFKCS